MDRRKFRKVWTRTDYMQELHVTSWQVSITPQSRAWLTRGAGLRLVRRLASTFCTGLLSGNLAGSAPPGCQRRVQMRRRVRRLPQTPWETTARGMGRARLACVERPLRFRGNLTTDGEGLSAMRCPRCPFIALSAKSQHSYSCILRENPAFTSARSPKRSHGRDRYFSMFLRRSEHARRSFRAAMNQFQWA